MRSQDGLPLCPPALDDADFLIRPNLSASDVPMLRRVIGGLFKLRKRLKVELA